MRSAPALLGAALLVACAPGDGAPRAEPIAPQVVRLTPPPPEPAGYREVLVDAVALGLPHAEADVLLYDAFPLTRALALDELLDEAQLSLAVRLLISEIGADRLVLSRNGIVEALGILQSVRNRLEPAGYNPEDRADAPVFEGCGPEGSFATCVVQPHQYLGVTTQRALAPRDVYDPELLEAAVDRAVLAWWLFDRRLVPDVTHGATNYVHRCGGAAYGMTTPHCDGHMGRPRRDVAGANPYTGPTMFQAPARWRPTRGYYALEASRFVHFDPWWTLGPDGMVLEAEGRFAHPFYVGDLDVDGLVEGTGPPLDPQLLEVLRPAVGAAATP